ncbi:glycosyltransferase [Chryseobacterium timonianum]|uniref:glycosyltransferase n=1 Tax=Chryseobacterium timonianum TaxID=1805473 RepID=UPI00083AB0E2|nr:glycosyltransferase [Chryseobacterium timonianum]
MRIGLLVGDITRPGGTEKALISLIKLFGKEHDFVIFSPASNEENVPFYKIPSQVKVHHFNLRSIPNTLFDKIKWYKKFYQLLKKETNKELFDYLIGYGHSMSIILSFFSKNNMSLYAYEHADYQTMPVLTKMLVNMLYKKLTGIIVLSKPAYINFKHLNKNVLVIPNYIEIPDNQTGNIKKDRIIMVGRLSEEKGYERIIPIAEKLKQDFPTWMIDIFGDGPLMNHLEQLYLDNDLMNVKLHGSVKNINQELNIAKIFIMTSYTEAMPFVILEAKTFELPVIAYENEGAKLLISDSIDGFLIKENDTVAFYEKLKSLILNEQDRIEKGKKGRQSLSEYSTEVVKNKWNKIFNLRS